MEYLRNKLIECLIKNIQQKMGVCFRSLTEVIKKIIPGILIVIPGMQNKIRKGEEYAHITFPETNSPI